MVNSFNFCEGRGSEVRYSVLLSREDVIQQIGEVRKKNFKRRMQGSHLLLRYKKRKETEEVSENGEGDC